MSSASWGATGPGGVLASRRSADMDGWLLSAAACVRAGCQLSRLVPGAEHLRRHRRSGGLASLRSADVDAWLLSAAACVHAVSQLASPLLSLRIRCSWVASLCSANVDGWLLSAAACVQWVSCERLVQASGH